MLLSIVVACIIMIFILYHVYFNIQSQKSVKFNKDANSSNNSISYNSQQLLPKSLTQINTGQKLILGHRYDLTYLSWVVNYKPGINPSTGEQLNVPYLHFSWVKDMNKATVFVYHCYDSGYLEDHRIRSHFIKYWDYSVAYNTSFLSFLKGPSDHILEIDNENLIVRSPEMSHASQYMLEDNDGKLMMIDMATQNLIQFKIILIT